MLSGESPQKSPVAKAVGQPSVQQSHSPAAPATSSASAPAGPEQFAPGGPVPAAAADAVRQLLSGTPAQQRAVLTTDLASALPQSGTLFPAGSTLTLDENSWRQTDGYANARGSLSEPGSAAVQVEVGFMAGQAPAGAWLVTFEAQLP
jgi:hypothetical protein